MEIKESNNMKINENKTIEINRGDRGTIVLKNKNGNFKVGDVLKFSILRKKDYNIVVFQKRYVISEESNTFNIGLTSEDTRIGDIISKPVTYWYEIEYNGDNTILGYDSKGAKKFILYPEAPNKEEE
jgi:hypothetical protein